MQVKKGAIFGQISIALGRNHALLHFAWGVAEAKCIFVTTVCVSVARRIPTLLHGPGCNLGNCMGCL